MKEGFVLQVTNDEGQLVSRHWFEELDDALFVLELMLENEEEDGHQVEQLDEFLWGVNFGCREGEEVERYNLYKVYFAKLPEEDK